jgi:hypothetical protein
MSRHNAPLFEDLTAAYIDGDLVNEATLHGADGKFTTRQRAKSISDGGSNFRSKRGGKRGKKVQTCGRDAREKGMDIRCYDGKDMKRGGAKGILRRIADTVKKGVSRARGR